MQGSSFPSGFFYGCKLHSSKRKGAEVQGIVYAVQVVDAQMLSHLVTVQKVLPGQRVLALQSSDGESLQ